MIGKGMLRLRSCFDGLLFRQAQHHTAFSVLVKQVVTLSLSKGLVSTDLCFDGLLLRQAQHDAAFSVTVSTLSL